MNITIADGKKMKTDAMSVECVGKCYDVGLFVRPDFVQDVKKNRKDTQAKSKKI